MDIPKRSPWGKVSWHKAYSDDVVLVSTAGHGGFAVRGQAWRNVLSAFPSVVASMMTTPGKDDNSWHWFEEDCEYGLVILANKELFTEKEIRTAESSVKNWYPFLWEEYSGAPPKAEESYILRKKLFETANRDKLVVVSARGLADGMVLCTAVIGGVHSNDSEAWFVKRRKYDERGEFGYVIDPDTDIQCPLSDAEAWSRLWSGADTMEKICNEAPAPKM